LAGVHNFLIREVVLQILHNLYPNVQVMTGVLVDQLTNVLSLVRAFLDDMTVVLEQMIEEELIELFLRTHSIIIDLSC